MMEDNCPESSYYFFNMSGCSHNCMWVSSVISALSSTVDDHDGSFNVCAWRARQVRAITNTRAYRPIYAKLHLISGLESLPFAVCPILKCADGPNQMALLSLLLHLHHSVLTFFAFLILPQ